MHICELNMWTSVARWEGGGLPVFDGNIPKLEPFWFTQFYEQIHQRNMLVLVQAHANLRMILPHNHLHKSQTPALWLEILRAYELLLQISRKYSSLI